MPFPGSVMSDQVATGLLAGLVVVVVVEGFVPAGRVVVGRVVIGNDVVIQDEWVLAGAGQLGSCVSVAAMA